MNRRRRGRDAGVLALDRVNQRAWTSPGALRDYARSTSWTDPGERLAVEWVADECAGAPILDVGVGAGRTIPILTAISPDYTGVDYTPDLLDQAAKRFPGADLRRMDARDMGALPSEHFGLVVFSCNGIDAVDYDDRLHILSEMRRVTRPGGLVVFSTHNRDGPGFDERPLRVRPKWSSNPLRFGWRVLRVLRQLPRWIVNYHRHEHLHRDFDGYSIRTANAHAFGIVILYTTVAEQRRQLRECGLDVERVFGSHGRRIVTDRDDAWWFHVIARRPPTGAAPASDDRQARY